MLMKIIDQEHFANNHIIEKLQKLTDLTDEELSLFGENKEDWLNFLDEKMQTFTDCFNAVVRKNYMMSMIENLYKYEPDKIAERESMFDFYVKTKCEEVALAINSLNEKSLTFCREYFIPHPLQQPYEEEKDHPIILRRVQETVNVLYNKEFEFEKNMENDKFYNGVVVPKPVTKLIDENER